MHVHSRQHALLQLATARAVKDALKTRATRPTKLELVGACEDAWPMALAVAALEEAGVGIQELTLAMSEQPEMPAGPATAQATVPTSMLAAMARSFANLKSLTCDANRVEAMPAPNLLPHLTALRLWEPAVEDQQLTDRTLPSIGLYLSRLTHLDLASDGIYTPSEMSSLFTPATISHTLQILSLDTILDDALLGLLLAYTPALEELAVGDIALQSDAHVHTSCRWRELTCGGTLQLSSVGRMPLPHDGREMVLVVSELICQVMNVEVELTCTQAATRMKLQCRLEDKSGFGHVYLALAEDGPPHAQAAALRSTFSVLRAFPTQAKPQCMCASFASWDGCGEWTITAPLMHELQRLPEWAVLHIWHVEWLPETPGLYAALLCQLPDSFHEVDIGLLPSRAHLESICLGVVGQRRQHPLRIQAGNPKAGVVESIQQTLAQLGASNRVLVTLYGVLRLLTQ